MFKTVILTLTIGLLLIGKAALAQDQAPAPTYHNGDSWQFSAIEKSPVASSTRALNGEFIIKLHRRDGDGTTRDLELTNYTPAQSASR
jgi:hypothetical protein